MFNSLIDKHIRRCARNMVGLNLALLLIVAAVVIGNKRYLLNCIGGPYPLSQAEAQAVTSPASLDHYFVTIKGDSAIDTGGTEVEQDTTDGDATDEQTTAHYIALALEHRLLLVKSATVDTSRVSYTGALIPLPDDVATTILDPIKRQVPEAKDAFLPALLDTGNFREAAYIGLAICLPLAVLGLFNIRRARHWAGKPETHPIGRALSSYGELETVSNQIESDLSGGKVEKVGHTLLGQNWLFRPWFLGVSVISIPHLVWVYEKVTTTKYLGVIPVSKSRAAELVDSFHRTVEIRGSKRQVKALLESLESRVPWVVSGYSDEIKKLVRDDFPAFVATVAERRRSRESASHA